MSSENSKFFSVKIYEINDKSNKPCAEQRNHQSSRGFCERSKAVKRAINAIAYNVENAYWQTDAQ